MSTKASVPLPTRASWRKEGLIGLWGRLTRRDPEAYEEWLEERDMIAIAACLMRLNERQLNRLGMSHATLALDVGDLALRVRREDQIASDVLQLVEDVPRDEQHAIAAE